MKMKFLIRLTRNIRNKEEDLKMRKYKKRKKER
jgi:hypothetical protein